MAILVSVANRQPATYYERLGTSADADPATLRAAYRDRARQLHPDLSQNDGSEMASVNEAWRVLSNPARRRAYDATLPKLVRSPPEPTLPRPRQAKAPTTRPSSGAAPPPRRNFARREQWVFGIQLQIRRLATLSARSAVQTLLVRHQGGQRLDYENLIEAIVVGLLADTENPQ